MAPYSGEGVRIQAYGVFEHGLCPEILYIVYLVLKEVKNLIDWSYDRIQGVVHTSSRPAANWAGRPSSLWIRARNANWRTGRSTSMCPADNETCCINDPRHLCLYLAIYHAFHVVTKRSNWPQAVPIVHHGRFKPFITTSCTNNLHILQLK